MTNIQKQAFAYLPKNIQSKNEPSIYCHVKKRKFRLFQFWDFMYQNIIQVIKVDKYNLRLTKTHGTSH